jgi:hypothetical protein
MFRYVGNLRDNDDENSREKQATTHPLPCAKPTRKSGRSILFGELNVPPNQHSNELAHCCTDLECQS